MKNLILIKKRFLIFRDEAKRIARIAKKRPKQNICFDFSKVDFISRSFADELLNIIASKNKIKIVNLKPHLKKFLNKIEKTKKTIEKL
jgi:anti-anti-sigma regulatory factor